MLGDGDSAGALVGADCAEEAEVKSGAVGVGVEGVALADCGAEEELAVGDLLAIAKYRILSLKVLSKLCLEDK